MFCLLLSIVNGEPDDVTVCKGVSVMFTWEWNITNSGIKCEDDNVQWYGLIKDASTTERVNQSINISCTIINDTLTTTLTITNTTKSYTGEYWVKLPSNDICNVSLTVTTSMSL